MAGAFTTTARPMARPSHYTSLPLLLALPLVAVGCAGEPPPPPPPPIAAVDVAPPPPSLDLPSAHLDNAQAARLLEGDPLALRFLALRTLVEDGLATPSEANPRIAANKGALLPLTSQQPPAVGLDRPLPAVSSMVGRFRALGDDGKGTPETRAGERDFLLDSLLPAAPAKRQPLSPPDISSARRLLTRLERLGDAGLITQAEQSAETQAVLALIDSGRLPETVAPPPPPPPPAKKPGRPGKAHPYHGYLAQVLPNPPGVEAPPLPAGSKGPAGVMLLSMSSASYGDTAWAALTKEHPDLAKLSFKVVKADLGELGTTYRLIAGPLEPAAAVNLCAGLTPKGQECTPTPFPP